MKAFCLLWFDIFSRSNFTTPQLHTQPTLQKLHSPHSKQVAKDSGCLRQLGCRPVLCYSWALRWTQAFLLMARLALERRVEFQYAFRIQCVIFRLDWCAYYQRKETVPLLRCHQKLMETNLSPKGQRRVNSWTVSEGSHHAFSRNLTHFPLMSLLFRAQPPQHSRGISVVSRMRSQVLGPFHA